jgi:hypothetical protein
MRYRVAWAASLLLVLAACASHEVLLPKSAVVPPGINLSGRWRLREEQSNSKLSEAERRAAASDGIPIPSSTRQRGTRSRPNRDSLVHVFLETGTTLKVTQTRDGLFISFDRAVVEEYRFGENREVTVGPVEAQRVSGWEQDAYVVETLDERDNKLIERYSLDDDGGVLLREVRILKKGNPGLTLVQRYDRVSS